jgi:hypothetical protein
MSGHDNEFQVKLIYKGEVLYNGPAFWDWDDDDETQIRISFNARKPEEF